MLLCLVLSALAACGMAVPSCSDPEEAANSSCPSSNQCWDNALSNTAIIVTWSLHGQCEQCTFAKQNDVIVQNTVEDVLFGTDGTFQRNSSLEIYKVNNPLQMRECDISEASMLGVLEPTGYLLSVQDYLANGANYFISLHSQDSDSINDMIPNNCEQGARMIIYKGTFDCGSDMALPCRSRGPCVFDHKSHNFTCRCPGGYKGNDCELIDECFENNACGNPEREGVCIDGDCDFSCSCIGGFSSSDGQGKSCNAAPRSCSSKSCLNGGTCVPNPSFIGFVCVCPPGLNLNTFLSCRKDDFCRSNPCMKGAACTDGVNQYSCSCTNGYSGSNCHININDCSPTPCLNGGVCSDGVSDVTCSCLSPRTGKFCQVFDDDGQACPCQNGATCVYGESSYFCLCVVGYTGLLCESELNECDSNPCSNGGTCHDMVNAFRCDCLPRSFGVSCETLDEACPSNPCRNGGTCVDLFLGFSCLCPLGFTGGYCQVPINVCASNPCNNGTCHELGELGRYRCECAEYVTGIHCEYRIVCVLAPCLYN